MAMDYISSPGIVLSILRRIQKSRKLSLRFQKRMGAPTVPIPGPELLKFRVLCGPHLRKGPYGRFYKLGAQFVGVLVIRALLSGVFIWAPYFGNSRIMSC